MSGYSTINMGVEAQKSGKSTWVVAAGAAVVGLAAGFAIVSVAETASLYTVPAKAVSTPVATMPLRAIQAQHVQTGTLYAARSPLEEVSTTAQQQSEGNTLLRPAFLLTSALALAWAAVKVAKTSSVAMMTTTAVKREWAAQSGKKYKSVQPIIAPSLLAADLANLAADSKRVLDAGADVLHVDVMDGHFVPNLSWGAPVIKCLRQHSNAFFDTHLMVSNPEDFIAPMADAGVDQFTFHIEAAKDPKALIKAIKDAGMKVGISVKPKTPIDVVFPYVNDVDLILVMTVEPGFGGQSFMEDMMPKVKTLREKYPNLDIQVDGGLSPKTIDAAAKAGANAIVAGSACFVADPKSAVDAMRESVEKYCTGPGL